MIGFMGTKPNYEEKPAHYKGMCGVHVVAYYYWILRNAGVAGIKLCRTVDELKGCDTVVCHLDQLANGKDANIAPGRRVIQVQLDRNVYPKASAVLVCDRSAPERIQKESGVPAFFVYQPVPVGIIPCTPTWPPRVLSYIGSRPAHPKWFTSDCVPGIRIRRQYGVWSNRGDEHVFLGPRDLEQRFHGTKSAAKLHTAWAMGIPSILSDTPSIVAERKMPTDYLSANTLEEFVEATHRVCYDRELYNYMVETARYRSAENSYKNIVQQFLNVLNK